jgi:hypothetical protein
MGGFVQDPNSGIMIPGTAPAPVDPAGGGFLNKLFSNKSAMQMLGAMGADFLGHTGGKNTFATLSQGIASKNYSDLLKNILGGKHPGVDAKLTDKGINLNIARETPVGEPGPDPGVTGLPPLTNAQVAGAVPGKQGAVAMPGSAPPIANASVPTPTPAPNQGVDSLNPFSGSQLDFTGLDLAGVDPQLITQALQFKLAGDELGFKKISELADMQYKENTLANATKKLQPEINKTLAETEKLNTENSNLNAPSDIQYPGLAQLTKPEFEKLPTEDKSYAVYYTAQKNLNAKKIMTREEWDNKKPTDREKFLRAAMQDPKLFKAAKDLAEAESTKIDLSPGQRKLSEADVEPRVQLKDPKQLAEMINKKLTADPANRNIINNGTPTERMKVKAKAAASTIEEMITAGQGNILKARIENGKLMWTVKWPDGTTEEIAHGINE